MLHATSMDCLVLLAQTLFRVRLVRCTFSSCKTIHLAAVTGMLKDEEAKAPGLECEHDLSPSFMDEGIWIIDMSFAILKCI